MNLEPRSCRWLRREWHGRSQPRRFMSKHAVPAPGGCLPNAAWSRVLDTNGSGVAFAENVGGARLWRCPHPHLSERSHGGRSTVVVEDQGRTRVHGPTHRLGVCADHCEVEKATAHDVRLSNYHRDHSRVMAGPVAQAAEEIEHAQRGPGWTSKEGSPSGFPDRDGRRDRTKPRRHRRRRDRCRRRQCGWHLLGTLQLEYARGPELPLLLYGPVK